MPTHSGGQSRLQLSKSSRESCNKSKPPGIVTTSVSLAAAFAEDANFIQIFGGRLDGRAPIEAAHRHIFETIYRGSHASFVPRSMRFLRPDVAVVFARAHVKFKEGNEAREIETRPSRPLAPAL
jgi:hypothetical protein